MAVTNGTNVSVVSAPTVGNPNVGLVMPTLQAQDGSFVGTALDNSTNPATPNMVAFDASGNVRWSVPGYTPQIATDDGGVIGISENTGSAVAFDQNGNAVGQIGDPTQSWTAQRYHIGSVERTAAAVISRAMTLWSSAGGNPSGSAAAPSTLSTAAAAWVLPSLPSVTEAKSYMPGVLANAQRVVNQIPACAALFGTVISRAAGFNPAAVLNALYANIGTVFAPATIVGGKPVSSSFVWSWFSKGREGAEVTSYYIGTSGFATGPRVYINVTNWNIEGENGPVDLNAMSAVLLHEMGHVYNDLISQGSGGSQIVHDDTSGTLSQENDQLIYRACFP
jgi:hypothetical protein